MDNTNNFASEDNFVFRDNELDPIEERWDYFIEQILKGNVIPVIGPDLLIAEHKNCHHYIINKLAASAKIESYYTSFSQLLYDNTFKNWMTNRNFTIDTIYRMLPQAD